MILELKDTKVELKVSTEIAAEVDPQELAELIVASGMMEAANATGVDPVAALHDMLGTPEIVSALLDGAGLDAIADYVTDLEAFNIGLPEAGPDLGGNDGTMMDGWHSDRGAPNWRTAQPGDIVYDDNGKEAGVMTENGIDIWLDGTDEDGDGKADSAVDSRGTQYLWPEEGHIEEGDGEEEEGGTPVIKTTKDLENENDAENKGDDAAGSVIKKAKEATGDDSSPKIESPSTTEEEDEEEEDTTEGDSTASNDSDDDVPGDTDTAAATGSGTDGTTQPGSGDDEGGMPDTFDFGDLDDLDETTQPGLDGGATSGGVVTVNGPGYGQTQPGFEEIHVIVNFDAEKLDPTYGTTQPSIDGALSAQQVDANLDAAAANLDDVFLI